MTVWVASKSWEGDPDSFEVVAVASSEERADEFIREDTRPNGSELKYPRVWTDGRGKGLIYYSVTMLELLT